MTMSAALQTLATLSLLSITAQAYTTFETNCTTPSTFPINYVSSPNSRGTLDILWSCLFTIFACTWTIQHLNVPEQRIPAAKKGRAHGLWCDFKWALKGFWSNLKWMLITMVAPEYILGKTIRDSFSAWRMREKMKDFASADGVEWDLAHSFYADMGGFVALEADVPTTGANLETERHGLEDTSLRVEELKAKHPEAPIQLAKQTFSLTAPVIHHLRARQNIDNLPDITTAEIHDKSKSSFFVKTVAVVQVFWVSIQVIVRATRGLAVSQLELAVTGFSVCAIITYILLIPKPQGVQVPSRPITCESGTVQAFENHGVFLRELLVPDLIEDKSGFSDFGRQKRIPNDMVGDSDQWLPIVYIGGMILGGVIFGGIHVAGWNLDFPTAIEQKLWRISSILMTCLLPVVFAPILLLAAATEFFPPVMVVWVTGVQMWGFVLGLIYAGARLFTLVEIFRTLLFLPSDAYISTWATNIPHVG